MQTTFHNTCGLTGEQLREAVKKARKQEEGILLIYKETRKKFTAGDIQGMCERAGLKHPITSTRRAITNLMNGGHLVKLSDQKKGQYGVSEFYYQLNFLKYPTKVSEQSNLFQ